MGRKQENEAFEEQLKRTDRALEHAADDLKCHKESLRRLQDERKRDVEETADFIKQLVNSQKNESAREMTRVLNEIEHLRRDIADKSSNTDLLNTKA